VRKASRDEKRSGGCDNVGNLRASGFGAVAPREVVESGHGYMASLVGKVDGFNGRGLFGWVRNRDDDSPQQIDILIDGVCIARKVIADRFRRDLARDGRSGNVGFAWELPLSASFGDDVRVTITSSRSGEVIAERAFHSPYSEVPWRGAIADPAAGALAGWVKRHGVMAPVIADVYVDDRLLSEGVVCDVPLSELGEVGAPGDGAFGFRVSLDELLPVSETVLICLREPASGATILSRNVSTKNLRESYRGHIEVSDRATLRAWAVKENRPADTFEVEVLLDGQPYVKVVNSLARGDLLKAGLSAGKGGLSFANPFYSWLIDGADHTLSLRFPDQTVSRDFEVTAIPRRSQGAQRGSTNPQERGVTIIVPIYNAADDVEVCLDRLLTYTPEFATILLIDDCSPDPRVAEILRRHRDVPRVRMLANPENLGFTRTVNRGILEAQDDDVVLLNSDARVTPGWLEGMLEAAASSPRIATVTAMSDRAGAFSAPMIGNDNVLPSGVDEITYARAFRRRSVGVYPRVPTGNGFCMWISRTCIDEIGALDEVAFPRGYGEENDFCMRAGRAGWIHVIDDRTYVFHDRSKSFGESKAELLGAGRAVVDSRYPEYKYAIRSFRTSPELALARNRAYLALKDAEVKASVRPRVLYVISTTTGGTPQTNADLMGALGDTVEPWVLRSDSRELTLSIVRDGVAREVRTHLLHDAVEPIGHFSPEYDSVVGSWLREFGFDIVHIRHLLWHSLSLPGVAKRSGARVVVSFHDYYALSPNLKLIDDQGVFLGESFAESGSVYRDSGWPLAQYPLPTGDWLRWWRERFWRAVQMCDSFVTTSASARDLILSQFTQMDPSRFRVIEHGRDFERFRFIAAPPVYGEPIRILVPGGINAAKGAEVLRDMVHADALGQIEWHILGPIKEKFDTGGAHVVYHGSYQREDFGRIVERIAPHAGAVLSIWDETYCHTLTEMWSVGLPVFVLDFPNVSDRVRRFGAGWVLEWNGHDSVIDQIIASLYDRDGRIAALRGVSDWQNGWGLAWTTSQMALRYLDIYRELLSEWTGDARDVLRVGVLTPSSRDLVHAPASTFTRVWERTQNSVGRSVDYIRVTPDGALATAREGLFDMLLVQRDAVPVAAAADLIAALDARGIPLVTELDEDLTEQAGAGDAHRRHAAVGRSTVASLVESSVAVSVPNDALRQRLAHRTAAVEVFRAALSDRLWRVPPAARVVDGKVRALYFGRRVHGSDLSVVLPALEAVAASNPAFELVLVGIASGSELDRIVEDHPWLVRVEPPERAGQYPAFVAWLREQSARVDFAIAPLAETERNVLASDMKLLEYLGLGLRTVATSFGPYEGTSVPGVTVVPNSTDAWVRAIEHVIADVEVFGPRIDELDWLLSNRMLSADQARFDTFVRDVAGVEAVAAHRGQRKRA